MTSWKIVTRALCLVFASGCLIEETDGAGGNDADDTTASTASSGPACTADLQCGVPLECATPRCVDGACKNTILLGETCQNGDGVCNGDGLCQVCAADAACTSLSECQRGKCNVTSCGIENAPTGTPCDGGMGYCDASGVCARACTSPAECTASSCHVPTCEGGMCGEDVAPAGGDCDWFGEPMGTCNATGTCEVCNAAPCETIDTHEPNDTQDVAYDLGTRTDCDHDALCAALGTVGDVDWYTYVGTDELGCNVATTVQFDSPDVRVCQYWACMGTPTTTTCPNGTVADTAPGGQHGCCGTGSWDHDPCDGLAFDDEDARVWIKVERLNGSACSAYGLALEY